MTSTRKILWLVALMIAVLVGCQPQSDANKDAPDAPAEASVEHGVVMDELPIKRVVLYQNGVGYFEREGDIDSDTLTLRIRPNQINDILKSLTVLDLDQRGKAISISLPVEKGAADALSDLPSQLHNEGGLLSLLRTFRGANVTLKTTDGDQAGRVVGVESIPSVSEKGHQNPGWRVMLQRADGSLDVIAIADITGAKIRDRSLELGLEKSLDVSLNEGSWKPIELKVRLDSAVKRRIRISYITEMPVWKPAYRLVIDGEGEGLFQGWSVVNNVSGGEWKDISMSLVAGNPISFSYNLYQPHYVTRPDLSGRVQYSALTPPKVESVAGGVEAPSYALAQPSAAPQRRARFKDAESGGRYAGAEDLDDFALDSTAAYGRAETGLDHYKSSFGPVAGGQELSSLYEYRVTHPGGPGVTIPDRSSSLVNIAQATGRAREIALFQPQPGQNYVAFNPYRAVEFHNESGQPLEPGPISLYRAKDADTTFIGESFMEKTEKGEMAFFTFAMDPRIELQSNEVERQTSSHITRIKDGVLTSQIKRVNTVEYTLKNKGDDDIEAVVSRPKRVGWDLGVSDNTTITEASHVNYLRVSIPAGEEVVVTLTEAQTSPQNMQINAYSATNIIDASLAAESVDPALQAALDAVMAQRAEITTINNTLAALYTARGEYEGIQRLNAELLDSISDINNAEANKLKRQYSKDMNDARTELVKTRAEVALLENKLRVEQIKLESLYQAVTFGEDT